MSLTPKHAIILGGPNGAGKTTPEDLKTAAALTEVMRRGIANAIKKNQQKGLPSPILKDGKLAYVMPDGSTKFKDELGSKG